MSPPEAAIELAHVSFRYEDVPVLEDISLTVPKGDFLAVIGPNGCGKTTLLRIILGLLSPTTGTVRVKGQAPESARSRIGYVAQNPELDRQFPVTVKEVVLMGRLGQSRLFGGYRKEDHEAAEAAMRDVDMDRLWGRLMGTLSGGQRQRVLIARALASRPEILLLDEPTAHVDSRAERDIYELLKRLNERTTIITVTHDLGFVSATVKRVACMDRRLLCHPTARVTAEMIERLYHGPVHMVDHHQVIDSEDAR